MFRSQGNPSPAPLTPTSTHPDEPFIQKKFSTLQPGDVKALAVSSIAVASSIGFPSLNQSHTPRSDEQKATHTPHADGDAIGSSTHRAAESAWQTAYSTARIVIDVAKESSDMVLPLKAVVGALSVLIKNYDRTMSNGRQVEEIEERVFSLSDILRLPLREDDHSERARRELLCRRLMDVLEKLEPLSEQKGLMKFLRNENHAGLLNGFIQDITRAITDYQTSLQQSTYEHTKDIGRTAKSIAEKTADIVHKATELIETADLETLGELNPVRNAGYRAEHHERCLSGTRESILEDMMRWAQNTQDQPVYWLNGLAGTGKSTIAQTFSEMTNNCDILGASFFCSRDYLDRKVLKNIFPTLAYQLACRYPRFRDHLVKVIKRDPSVAHNSLISQLRDLLVDPLSATGISCVIVIDALDECVDDQPASAILSVLGRLVSKLPSVKFFITGRPEARIRSGFRLPLLEPFTQVFLLHEVEPTSVGGDIRLYLVEKLDSIAKRRSDLDLPELWPSNDDITVLVKKSSGLFVFASTVVRFIESEHDDPRERLRLIVRKADDTSHEGASGVDSLYSQVLRDAFSGIKEETVFDDLKRILSAVVLALNPLSRDGLAQLLNVDSTVISTMLRHLHSVILVPTDRAKEIRVFHKSFPDFLQDPDRCRDRRFYIDLPTCHRGMALSCLGLLGKLEINPCALPPFVMNEDIPDRPRLIGKLGSGLRYACEYWSTHLSFSPWMYGDGLITSISMFFDRTVFPWMEVMSLEGHLEGVIHSLNQLSNWLDRVTFEDPPRDLTDDCLRFTLHFFRPIQLSAQHIYHTALPLSPETSILRSRFFKNYPSLKEDWTTRQTSSSSVPTSWRQILRTIKAYSGSFTHVAVAGERIVAVCKDNTVNVYAAVTGILRLSLNPPEQVTKAEGSPDGSVLFFVHQAHKITVWDTQTGGLVRTLTTGSDIGDIAVSSRGMYLGSCSSDGTFGFWEVGSRSEGLNTLGKAVVCFCWLEPEDQVALGLEGSITILGVTTGRTLRTYVVGGVLRGITFSARQHQLAFLFIRQEAEAEVGTIDMRIDVMLESPHTLRDVSRLTFSDDGSQVICATNQGNLLSYKPGFSSRWARHLGNLGTISSMFPLRGGHLVVGSGDSIQLLGSEYTQPSKVCRGTEITHVYQLDDDKIICGSSEGHENVSLLDVETMKTLGNHGLKLDELDASFTPPFLCASFDKFIVLRVRNHDNFALRLYDIARTSLIWESLSSRSVLMGALSPRGGYLITVGGSGDSSGGGVWELCIRGVWSGKVLNHIPFILKGRLPSKIAFISREKFYIEELRVFSTPPRHEDMSDCEDHRVQTTSTPPTASTNPSTYPRVPDVTPRTRSIPGTWWVPRTTTSKQPEVCHTSPRVRKSITPGSDEMTTSTTTSEGQPRTAVRHEHRVRKTFSLKTVGSRLQIEEEPGEEILPAQLYSLDENLEWVLDAESRRMCWLPPGYVTEIENGHFFVGSSIFTAGQDGIVRKLTFREPRSNS